ncbi:MAG: hypothetical protein R3E32_14360 [Chitinophagales bacterium]
MSLIFHPKSKMYRVAKKIDTTFKVETFEVYSLRNIDFHCNREPLKQNFKSLNRELILLTFHSKIVEAMALTKLIDCHNEYCREDKNKNFTE